jgi:DNA helicase IV
VVVDGGPGTGKTTTLIQRLKCLISRLELEDNMLNNPDIKITDEQFHCNIL